MSIIDPKKQKKAKTVYMPNRLREKVGGSHGKIGSIDPDIIAKAEKKVEEISANYGSQAVDEVTELEAAFASCKLGDDDQTVYLRRINRLVHDIRGQGSSFGYPLLTEFATSLFDFTDYLEKANEQQLQIIKAHIDVMHVVVHQKMKGDGGAVGQQLKQTLEIAKKKYS